MKFFGVDALKTMEIQLYREYNKEIIALDIAFGETIGKHVDNYEDEQAHELAAVKGETVNPLISEQYKLLAVMREQIAQSTLDVADTRKRMKLFDERKQMIAEALSR